MKKLFKQIQKKLSKITIVDMGLTKLSVAAFILMIAKLWQPILSLQWYWYLVIGVVAAIKPVMLLCKKK